jgi:hypothetical protein
MSNLALVDKRLIGPKFWGDFESLPRFSRIMSFASFEGAGSDQAEGSDWINVLNAQEDFLENTGEIHLECHQTHRPYPISRIILVFLLRRHRIGN